MDVGKLDPQRAAGDLLLFQSHLLDCSGEVVSGDDRSGMAHDRWSGCSSRREQIASSRMKLAPHPKMKPGGSAGELSDLLPV